MKLHDEITKQILMDMETAKANNTPWHAPWHQVGGSIPFNASTGREYKGINTIQLWLQASKKGYRSNAWGTFKQWQGMKQAGEMVLMPDQKGTVAVFYTRTKGKIDPETGERQFYNMAKAFHVFNVDQVKDGHKMIKEDKKETPEFTPDQTAEMWINSQEASIQYGFDQACYVPARDEIRMPSRIAFDSPNDFYSVCFHELAHFTEGKLGKKLSTKYGSELYAEGELTAEISAAFLCAETKLEASKPRKDHAIYLNSWIKRLKDDSTFIFKASAQASRIVEHMRLNYLVACEGDTLAIEGLAETVNG